MSESLLPKLSEKEHEAAPFIVGIGASAGGLESLEDFFSNLPENSGLAFVVVQHLSPQFKSMMKELLTKHTPLKVVMAKNGTWVSKNHVYLIPPNKVMTIQDGSLYLKPRGEKGRPNYPIDTFFFSLAQDQGSKAISIVLSGTGTDGTRGIRTIKEEGGMVMVQDEETAKFDGMPLSAISTGLADYILPATKMGVALFRYTQNSTIMDPKEAIPKVNDTFIQILQIIKRNTKIDFTFYKRTTLGRRLTKRMNMLTANTLEEYLDLLKTKPSEVQALKNELLISVTKFFRDTKTWDKLKDDVIPKIFENATNNQIRVWIPGCATGEEAYSLAMYLYLHARTLKTPYIIKIFATDVSERAIRVASKGQYPESISQDIKEEYLQQFFIRQGEKYVVSKFIRDMIVFTIQDITKDPPFNRLDLISCRNLLIYFQPVLQRKVFAIFSFSLNQSGFLLLGGSEAHQAQEEIFLPYDNATCIYQTAFSARPHKLPMFLQSESVSSGLGVIEPPFKTNSNLFSFKAKILEAMTQMLVNQFVTAAVLMNEKFELIRHFGNASSFLSVPTEPSSSWNVLNMIKSNISVTLATAARKVLKQGSKVKYNNIYVESKSAKPYTLHLTVIPYPLENSEQTLMLVLFEKVEIKKLAAERIEEFQPKEETIQLIKDLEQELKITRENLQATIEELRTSNEELLASNEELQSTNEELQSVNEELHTINAEHQASIQELTEANDDINNLLQSTQIGTIFLDNELRIRKFNSSATDGVNVTDRDIGRPIEHFSTNLNYPNLAQNVKEVLRKLIPFEEEVQSSQGRWFLLRILPYRTVRDEINGVVITFVDINILKEAEVLETLTQSLKESNKMLKEEVKERKKVQLELINRNHEFEVLFETLPDLYLKLDRRGTYKDFKVGKFNHHAEYFMKQDVVGKTVRDVLPDYLVDGFEMAIEEALDTKKVTSTTYSIERKNGNSRSYELRVIPLNETEVVATVHDITELIHIKEDLIRTKEQVRTLAKSIPDGAVAVFDKDFRFTLSEGKILPEGSENKTLHEAMPPERVEELKKYYQAALEGKASSIESNYHGDTYVSHFIPVRNDTRQVFAGMVISQRITDVKKVKKELEDKIMDLEQFAFAVSHDLKEPVRSIVGFSQLLSNKYGKILKGDGIEYLDFITTNTKRMRELIDGLLNYSRIGKEDPNFEEVNVKEIITKCKSNLNATLNEHNVAITTRGLPVVTGNYIHLTQVFQNLIANAIKYNDKKKRTIHISSKNVDDYWLFQVKDNGIGIDQKYHQEVFKIFKHLHTDKAYRGSGIGLALCKKIIQGVGGQIWIKSKPNQGATFLFTWPVAPNATV